MRRRGGAAALLTLAWLLAGCRSPLSRRADPSSLGSDFALVGVAELPASTGDEGCGAQALAVALAHFDAGIDPRQLCDELPWHESGATVVDLLAAARRRGFQVSLQQGTLATLDAAIAADQVALVLLDVQTEHWLPLGWHAVAPRMHWAVVSGRNDADIVLAGRGPSYLVDAKLFDERWAASSRCTVIVLGK